MRLKVNGSEQDVAAATLAEALEVLDYSGTVVATALNGSFVPAKVRRDTRLTDGDAIEIVAPKQGG